MVLHAETLMPDTISHGLTGALIVYPFLRRWYWLALGLVLGMLPDLIGAYGNIILHDNWDLYLSAHSGTIYDWLKWFPPYWAHCWLDSFTHGVNRWWVWNEGLWIEVVVVVVNVGIIWAIRQTKIQSE